MNFRLFVSNAEGLNLGPERYASMHDAIAAATRHIARRRGTGWRVRVLDEGICCVGRLEASCRTAAPGSGRQAEHPVDEGPLGRQVVGGRGAHLSLGFRCVG